MVEMLVVEEPALGEVDLYIGGFNVWLGEEGGMEKVRMSVLTWGAISSPPADRRTWAG